MRNATKKQAMAPSRHTMNPSNLHHRVNISPKTHPRAQLTAPISIAQSTPPPRSTAHSSAAGRTSHQSRCKSERTGCPTSTTTEPVVSRRSPLLPIGTGRDLLGNFALSTARAPWYALKMDEEKVQVMSSVAAAMDTLFLTLDWGLA